MVCRCWCQEQNLVVLGKGGGAPMPWGGGKWSKSLLSGRRHTRNFAICLSLAGNENDLTLSFSLLLVTEYRGLSPSITDAPRIQFTGRNRTQFHNLTEARPLLTLSHITLTLVRLSLPLPPVPFMKSVEWFLWSREFPLGIFRSVNSSR